MTEFKTDVNTQKSVTVIQWPCHSCGKINTFNIDIPSPMTAYTCECEITIEFAGILSIQLQGIDTEPQ